MTVIETRLLNKCPKWLHGKIRAIWQDIDGYWVELITGYHFVSTECHTERNETWKGLREALNRSNIEAVEDDWSW